MFSIILTSFAFEVIIDLIENNLIRDWNIKIGKQLLNEKIARLRSLFHALDALKAIGNAGV